MRSIQLQGCETWPMLVGDERVLAVFEKDSVRSSSVRGVVVVVVVV